MATGCCGALRLDSRIAGRSFGPAALAGRPLPALAAGHHVALKYVNNDACYPSILVAGQMMEALTSGEYDVNKTALIISQTGGGCRATNYIGFIRKALKAVSYTHLDVYKRQVFPLQGLALLLMLEE